MNLLKTTAALAAFTAGAAIFTCPANAAVIDYAKISFGQVDTADVNGYELSGGDVFGVAVGKAVGPLRVELGYNQLQAGTDFGVAVDGRARDLNAMAYVDIPVGHNTTIYGGAGVDYVNARATLVGHSFSADGYGYSYGGGIATRISDHLIAEAQYRQLEVSDLGGVDLSNGIATVGLRMSF